MQSKLKVLHVVGARSNFMKAAPVMWKMSKNADSFEQILVHTGQHLQIIKPMKYLEFLGLERNVKLIITDSVGIQEEITYLGVSCLTVRSKTKRPVTISQGTKNLINSS